VQRPRHDRGGSCRWWATSRTSRPLSGSLTLTPTLTLARALDLALGPRPNRNPKQAAELIANLQEAMCRRQEEAELKLATARTAVPISPLPPLPSNGPRPAAAQLVAWRVVWRAARRAARRVDDAMACGRGHSVLLASVVRVRRGPPNSSVVAPVTSPSCVLMFL